MSEIPPPHYVAYPRGDNLNSYGTVEKLEALGQGYLGLNYVFYVNILLVLAARAASAGGGIPVLIVLGFILIVVSGLSYPQNKKIVYGLGWPSSIAILASVLMGINSALCCGIIGYVVMQNFAIKEIRKYGLGKTGFFGGLNKAKLRALVDKRRLADAASATPYTVPQTEPGSEV